MGRADEPPPGFDLLVAATRRPCDGAEPALAADGPTWSAALDLARRHRVVGLLADAARSAAPPPEIAEALATARRNALLHEMACLSTARTVFRAMGVAGLDPVLVKGLQLSQEAYGRLGLRTNRDLDLLIPADDVDRASSVLCELGFHRFEPPAAAPPHRVAGWRRLRKDFGFLHGPSGMVVELHWRLFDNRAFWSASPLSVARRQTIFGCTGIRTLPPTHNLAYLAGHGALHAWSRLKWLADFRTLLKRQHGPLDAFETAASGGLALAFLQAVALCERIYGDELPAPLVRRVRTVRVRWLAKIAFEAMTRHGAEEIEAVPRATTLKNLSHYGLRSTPRYWLHEVAFDLHERVFPR